MTKVVIKILQGSAVTQTVSYSMSLPKIMKTKWAHFSDTV